MIDHMIVGLLIVRLLVGLVELPPPSYLGPADGGSTGDAGIGAAPPRYVILISSPLISSIFSMQPDDHPRQLEPGMEDGEGPFGPQRLRRSGRASPGTWRLETRASQVSAPFRKETSQTDPLDLPRHSHPSASRPAAIRYRGR